MEPEDPGWSSKPRGGSTYKSFRGNLLWKGGAASSSSKGRRLFPLPKFACPPAKWGVSRTVSKRRSGIQRMTENVNQVIDSLNWMAGCKDASPIPLSSMQEDVLARLEGLVFDQKPSANVPSNEEALRELLKGGTPYDFGSSQETLASYQSELVSVPDSVKHCPRLEDVLPPDDLRYLEEKSELMLRPKEKVDECREDRVPYWDPKLRFNKKEYNKLVQRLHEIGYFNYTLTPSCRVGVFFVWKSSRTKLRLITDARCSNQKFLEAPGVSLMTSEGMGRIELEIEENLAGDGKVLDGVAIHLGLSDVKDCFHRLRVPFWLSKFFCWAAVPAKVVGLAGAELEGKVLKPLDAVYPCPGSLCQGFSWSLYFAQRANEEICRRCSILGHSIISNDRGRPIVLRLGGSGEVANYYVYVDNLGVLHQDLSLVEKAMSELQEAFNSRGLLLHTTDISEGATLALGCIVEGEKFRSRISPVRLWKIYKAISGLLHRGRCSGQVLEILVGHLTFVGLMWRSSLSILHTVYKFIHRHYNEVAKIWSSVAEELRCFQGVLFLLVQDWSRQWNTLVSSSDASLTGYGVCHAEWDRKQVADTGRVLERSRFKRSSGHSARESALHAAGFSFQEGKWEKVVGSIDSLRAAGWELQQDFPEVPSAGLRRELWQPKMWGTWKFHENILVLEARTVLLSLKRIALTTFGHDLRQLLLCDNMSVVLSFERCRSKNFKLLRIIREFSAFCMARNIHVAIRWVPSEFNIADEPSRLHESEKSSLLVDLLDDFWPGSKSVSSPLTHVTEESAAAFEQQQQQCEDTRNGSGENSGSYTEKAVGTGQFSGQATSNEYTVKEVQDIGHRTVLGKPPQGEANCQHQTAPVTDGTKAVGDGDKVVQGEEQRRELWRQRKRDRQYLVRAQGRENRKQKARAVWQAKRFAESHGGPGDGEIPGHPVPPGELCCDLACEGALRQEVCRAPQVHCGPASSIPGGHRRRQCSGDVLQPEVSRRRRKSLRRLHHCCPDGQTTCLWETRSTPYPKSVEVPEGMAKVVPISLEACIPVSGVVWNQLENGGTWSCAEGCVQPGPSQLIPSSRNLVETEEVGVGEAHVGHHWPLVFGDITDGDSGHQQDWHQGRQHFLGFKLDPVYAPCSFGAEPWKKGRYGMELQLWRVPISLSRLLPRLENRCRAIPSTALGTERRQISKHSQSRRSSKARRLGISPVSGKVREVREACSNLEQASHSYSKCDAKLRKAHCRDHPRPTLSHNLSVKAYSGGYFADFFAGKAGVARAVRSCGFSTREWELLKGADNDLTCPQVVHKVLSDINSDKVLGAMFAPPCASFSPARDRTMVVRDRDFPWGIPGLPPHEAFKVEIGNKCFKSSLKIIRALDRKGIPWVLENPHSSKCWRLAPLVKLLASSHVHCRVVDFCMYKTPWRKRTRLVFGNINMADTERFLHRFCSGRGGVCDNSHKKHFHLTGSARDGRPWTLVAQPYPSHLCHDIAYSLTTKYNVIPYNPGSI